MNFLNIFLPSFLLTISNGIAVSIVHKSKPFNPEGLIRDPGNEWGSYYNINMTQETETFSRIFSQVTSADTPCAGTDMKLLRYYKSYDKADERIYSYFCRKSKGYEHLLCNFQTKKLISFHTKLSDFKIYDAGSYPRGLTIRDKEEVLATTKKGRGTSNMIPKKIWEHVWNKFEVPEECVDPDVRGTDHVDTKYENYLLYYRFPLICSHGLRRIEVNIFVDVMYGRYFEGKPTLCFTEQMVSNLKFLMEGDD